jgi:hypothetical protein
MAKAQAAQRGMAASAWVAKLIRDAAVVEASRRYDEYNRCLRILVDEPTEDFVRRTGVEDVHAPGSSLHRNSA